MPATDRTVLITGASRGIGEACALHLAGAGMRVFAGVRRDADAEALRAKSERITPVLLDVTDGAHVDAVAELIAGETAERGLDGLVNNAGIAIGGPLEFLPITELRRQLEVNVVGQVALTQAVLSQLRLARGRIVFIGSIAGRSALPYVAPYAASKFAIEAIADALRIELRPWEIEVSVVEPGAIATPIWERSIETAMRNLEGASPDMEELYGERLQRIRRALSGERGIPPANVAKAVEDALTARRPKTRYLVGNDARIRRLLELLPDRVRDAVVERQVRRL